MYTRIYTHVCMYHVFPNTQTGKPGLSNSGRRHATAAAVCSRVAFLPQESEKAALTKFSSAYDMIQQ